MFVSDVDRDGIQRITVCISCKERYLNNVPLGFCECSCIYVLNDHKKNQYAIYYQNGNNFKKLRTGKDEVLSAEELVKYVESLGYKTYECKDFKSKKER